MADKLNEYKEPLEQETRLLKVILVYNYNILFIDCHPYSGSKTGPRSPGVARQMDRLLQELLRQPKAPSPPLRRIPDQLGQSLKLLNSQFSLSYYVNCFDGNKPTRPPKGSPPRSTMNITSL